ncbi:MAG: hypothetical protein ACOYL8_00410 [Patescibacteria group bacterium]
MNASDLTSRDKEIISLVSKSLGLKTESNPDSTISKDRIHVILNSLEKKHWSKYDFHNINIAVISFIRACRKIDRGILKFFPSSLALVWPQSRGDDFDFYFCE